MSKLWKAKLSAFGIHILFSITIISVFMALVTQVWFPGLLFHLEDVWEGLRILVPVDAILGPILTLILFVPGKKGLVGDLVIVVLLQISALIYGAYTIYDQRPEAIVFAGDRFEVLPASKFDKSQLQETEFDLEKLPYPLVTYSLPAQSEEERKIFIFDNVQYQKMAERFRPIEGHREKVLSRALNIDYFTPKSDATTKALAQLRETYDTNKHALFVLESTTAMSAVMILNKSDFSIQGYVNIDPWDEYNRPVKQP